MQKPKIHLAVIDDGINEKLYSLEKLEYNLEITPDIEINERTGYDPYSQSHGTTCAAIIKNNLPDAQFSSIKVLNSSLKGINDQLVKAIEWCCENDIQLVNMSLGTIDYRNFPYLKTAVNKAYRKGMIIVAACSNKNIITYPASLSNTIGVKCDKVDNLKYGEYTYDSHAMDGVEVTACGKHILKDCSGKEVIIYPSNSFAAPLITSIVYNIMEKNPGIALEEIKKVLEMGSAKHNLIRVKSPCLYRNIDWVETATVFFLSNGKNSLLNIPYNVKIDGEHILECHSISEGISKVKDFIGKNIFVLESVDTIVIIIDSTLPKETNTGNGTLMKEITTIKKNIIYINDYCSPEELNLDNLDFRTRIWHPAIHRFFKGNIENTICMDIPLIAVYNFAGSEYIKIINGMTELFKKDGYNAVAATESSLGIVAGFEFCPIKNVNGNIDTSELMGLNAMYNPDLIIYGFNAMNEDLTYFCELDRALVPDIKIFVIRKYDKFIKNIVENNIAKSELVIVEIEHHGNMNYNHAKTFYSLEDSSLSELYNHIISLLLVSTIE